MLKEDKVLGNTINKEQVKLCQLFLCFFLRKLAKRNKTSRPSGTKQKQTHPETYIDLETYIQAIHQTKGIPTCTLTVWGHSQTKHLSVDTSSPKPHSTPQIPIPLFDPTCYHGLY